MQGTEENYSTEELTLKWINAVVPSETNYQLTGVQPNQRGADCSSR